MDLEKIQAQLKSHIRQHQILIQEMKRDPQNVEIQQKVQSLQAELNHLSEKQRQVVQQLKQNIQPRPEGYDHDVANHHIQQMQSPISDGRRELLPNSEMTAGNPSFHRSPTVAMGRHFVLNTQLPSRVSPPPSTKFIPSITQNNIVHLKEDKEASLMRKPNIVTTGMQLIPAAKDSMRSILPRPEARKPKVSLETTRPEHSGKQSPEKLNFLSTLGLITVSKCREINSQKHERRRRTSAIFSPYSSFQFFDEPKKSSTGIKRGRGRPMKNGDSDLKSPLSPSPVFVPINGFKSPNEEHRSDKPTSRNLPSQSSPKAGEHEDHCAVCQQSGEVLMCDTCILVYHLKCLSPPLTRIPMGMWMCPKCQESIKNKEPMEWPGTLAVAHSYLKHRVEKDKEKQKLLSRNQELKLQELELQKKVNELSSALVTQIQKKTEIVESTRQAQEKLQKLKRFIQTVHST